MSQVRQEVRLPSAVDRKRFQGRLAGYLLQIYDLIAANGGVKTAG